MVALTAWIFATVRGSGPPSPHSRQIVVWALHKEYLDGWVDLAKIAPWSWAIILDRSCYPQDRVVPPVLLLGQLGGPIFGGGAPRCSSPLGFLNPAGGPGEKPRRT